MRRERCTQYLPAAESGILGSARASRADFGALAGIPLCPVPSGKRKVRDHEGVIASSRGRMRSPWKS
jgi:hypothetical protein